MPRKQEKPEEPIVIYNSGELRFNDKLTAEKVDGVWQEPLQFLNNYSRNVFEEEQKETERRERKRVTREAKRREW